MNTRPESARPASTLWRRIKEDLLFVGAMICILPFLGLVALAMHDMPDPGKLDE